MSNQLPKNIAPMLLKSGTPFDSSDFLFEIKWDGTRALAYVDETETRLINRRQNVMTDRYPDLVPAVSNLPAGTVLDGEIIVLQDGKPDFPLLQSREQARTDLKVKALSQSTPATYMVFDLLYNRGELTMARPLDERRSQLRDILSELADPRIVMSEGVAEHGVRYFQLAVDQELEGIVAKRITSQYTPGKRSDAWIKIKRGDETLCAIVGFLPADGGASTSDFQSLILATILDGDLTYCGRVGSGIDFETRILINELIWNRISPTTVVRSAQQKLSSKAIWVQPGLFCKIRYMERTKNNEFRAPVFEDLIVE